MNKIKKFFIYKYKMSETPQTLFNSAVNKRIEAQRNYDLAVNDLKLIESSDTSFSNKTDANQAVINAQAILVEAINNVEIVRRSINTYNRRKPLIPHWMFIIIIICIILFLVYKYLLKHMFGDNLKFPKFPGINESLKTQPTFF